MKKTFYWSLSLVLTLAALIFALQNSGILQVRFFVWSFAGNMAAALIAVFALGLGVGFLAALPLLLGRGRRERPPKEEPKKEEPGV